MAAIVERPLAATSALVLSGQRLCLYMSNHAYPYHYEADRWNELGGFIHIWRGDERVDWWPVAQVGLISWNW